MSLVPSLKVAKREQFLLRLTLFLPYLQLTVKIFQFLRLSTKFWPFYAYRLTPLRPSSKGTLLNTVKANTIYHLSEQFLLQTHEIMELLTIPTPKNNTDSSKYLYFAKTVYDVCTPDL